MLPVLFSVFFILMILNVPIAYTMGISCLCALLSANLPINTIITRMFVAVDSFSLMAVPFFILSGELMNEGKLTDKLLEFASSLVGHLKGGLAMVNIAASVMFAGLSGSATADTAALGALEIPLMVKGGYSKQFSVAVTIASSTIGPIIPPSVMLVMYAVVANVSISKILVAGLIPGLLMALAQGVMVYIISMKRGYGSAGKFSFKKVIHTFKGAILPLMIPLIILGGILGGIFTATEAGVVACVYALFIGLVVNKTLKIKDLPAILLSAAKTSSISMMIIGMANIFSWIMAWESFPSTVASAVTSITSSSTMFMFLIIAFLIFLGLFIEGIPVLIVFAPILVPIARFYGIDLIAFGVILVITILVGSLTPPVGSLLYLGCSIANTKVSDTGKEVWPFVLAILAVIILCVVFPQIIIFLPNILLR